MPEVVLVLRAVRLGQQDVDLEPDDFLLVVAEHPLAGMIEQLDPPLVVEQHDRVDCSVKHGLELPLQAVCPLFLRLGDAQYGHGAI
jgi:hypothetical protein